MYKPHISYKCGSKEQSENGKKVNTLTRIQANCHIKSEFVEQVQ